MSEEQDKKPKKKDGRAISSKKNFELARQRKLELLKKKKEEANKQQYESESSESEYETESDSDEEEIVIRKTKKKGKGKNQQAPLATPPVIQQPGNPGQTDLMKEINALKQMMSDMAKKKKKKKNVNVKIVKEVQAPQPALVAPRQDDLEAIKKRMLINF